jgi:hypothetical protein
MTRLRHRFALSLLCGLAGCTTAGLSADSRLQYEIIRYYAHHATEQNDLCLAPEIRGITRMEVLEETPDRLVLRVRYNWVDEIYGEEDANGLGVMVHRCNGFAERVFTIDRRDGGRVVDMTGPKRSS